MTNILLKKFTNFLNYQLNYLHKVQLELKKKSKDLINNQISENFYLFMSFSFILFIYGFYFSLKSKYKDQFTEDFIKNNLPGISQPTQNMNWETFENILMKEVKFQNHKYLSNVSLESTNNSKTNLLRHPFIKQIDFYTDHINIKLDPILNKKKNQEFVGFFLNKNKINTKNVLNQSLFKIDSRDITKIKNKNIVFHLSYPLWKLNDIKNTNLYSYVHRYQTSLDEIPSKIDSKQTSTNQLSLYELHKVLNSKKFEPIKKIQEKQTVIRKKRTNFVLAYEEKGKIPKNFEKTSNQNSTGSFKFFDKKPNLNSIQLIAIFDGTFSKRITFQREEPIRDGIRIEPSLNHLKNQYLVEETQLVKKKNEINTEIKNLFFLKGISPPNVLPSSMESLKKALITKGKNPAEISLKTEFGNKNKTFEKKYQQISERGLTSLLKTEKIHNNFWLKPRQMSGYFFPDMSEKEIKKTFLQLFFQNFSKKNSRFQTNLNLHIILPPSCEIPVETQLLNQTPPKLDFQYIRTILAGQSHLDSLLKNDSELLPREKIEIIPISQFVYKGPGLFLNKKTNDLFINNNDDLEKWKNFIFGIESHLTDKKENFFGKKNFLHGEKITERKLIELKKQSIDKGFLWNNEKNINKIETSLPSAMESLTKALPSPMESSKEALLHKEKKPSEMTLYKKLPLKKTELNREFFFKKRNEKNKKIDRRFDLTKNKIYKTHTIVPVFEFSTIPYLSPKNWYKILKAQIEETILKETDLTKIKISIPSFVIGIGKKEEIYSPISQLEYQNLYQFVFTKNHLNDEKNIFHFLPWTQSTNQEASIQHSLIDGIYKKNLTLSQTQNSFNAFVKDSIKDSNEKIKNWHNSKSIPNTTINSKNFHFLNEAKKETFQESWQSITTESWMVIYKICFALWLQEIAKDFYKKYGKEILFYVIDLFAALGFDTRDVIDQLQLGNSQNNLRIICKTNKRFENVAGIDTLLPELSEIVWFLRNSARGSQIPKGILFIGPPGTGKTFLVQAIAGEAQIPVVVQSASSLIDMEEKQSGSQRLKNVFEKARELAPCILFIDEIDTLGAARENVMINTMGEDQLLESIYQISTKKDTLERSFIPNPKLNAFVKDSIEDRTGENPLNVNQEKDYVPEEELANIFQSHQEKNQIKQHRLALLMQFLVEMDGLKSLNGVIVIGATNRASVLDPAFTRPGRFEKILELGLPSKNKRIEILKLYSQNLGITKTVSWDYLGNMTEGLSAADLSAAMNQSSLKAILNDSIHSLETIEYGIHTITRQTLNSEKPKSKQYNDLFFMKRLAFYQAGKIVIQSLLPNHPTLTYLSIWPENNITGNRQQKYNLEKLGRSELETLLTGFYAGKASEILALIENLKIKKGSNKNTRLNSFYFWESNLGSNELKNASDLIISMIENWYFYSKKVLIQKETEMTRNQNKIEIQDPLLLDLFQNLYQKLRSETHSKTHFQKNLQNWLIPCWWQQEVKNQSELVDPAYAHWYRLYLPDPEETERNEEWVAPDQFFNSTQNLKNLSNLFIKIKNKREINWNDFSQINRDYIYYGLISNSFNKAFSILDENRELLDVFASYLLKFEKMREPEIKIILKKFHPTKRRKKDVNSLKIQSQNRSFKNSSENTNLSFGEQYNENGIFSLDKNIKKITNIEENWGNLSRRKKSFFINFDLCKKTF